MIRYTLLTLFIIYALRITAKDWYKGLCLIVPMIALLKRPDMPREMFGITGANPYNLVLLFVFFCFLSQYRAKIKHEHIDKGVKFFLSSYMIVVFISFLRMILDTPGWEQYRMYFGFPPPTYGEMIADGFINQIKWTIPGILMIYGADTPERRMWGIKAILAGSALFALMTISKMIPALLGHDDLARRALRVLDRDIGYHRVDLAAITASGALAFYAVRQFTVGRLKLAYLFGSLICIGAMALTGGRAGMYAFVVVGGVFAIFKWKRLILLAPLLAVLMLVAIPGLKDRLLDGFFGHEEEYALQSYNDSEGNNLYAITSGRVVLWPIVIDSIKLRPLVGYGMAAMQRNGDYRKIYEILGKTGLEFKHPHNAYLQLFLENGLIGGFFVLAFYTKLGFKAITKLRAKNLPEEAYILSSVFIAFVFVQAVAGMGSQSFYPREGTMQMWCAIGLFIRYFYYTENTRQPGTLPGSIR